MKSLGERGLVQPCQDRAVCDCPSRRNSRSAKCPHKSSPIHYGQSLSMRGALSGPRAHNFGRELLVLEKVLRTSTRKECWPEFPIST